MNGPVAPLGWWPVRGPGFRDSWSRAGVGVALLVAFLLLAGCSVGSIRPSPPQPGRTSVGSPLVVLPAQLIGNFLVIEAKWDRFGPYRFLIDTGSSVTLVSPALVQRYPGRGVVGAGAPPLRVRGAEGRVVELPRGSLRRLELGDARFEDVEVLLYDCAPLSAHLGVAIDGVLGFPLFRDTLLTLDYPGQQVVLRPTASAAPMPGTTLAFDDARKTPLISLRLGERSLLALIDSGSDAAFSLNPVGTGSRFLAGPTPGAMVGTIAGEREQRVGRLEGALAVGDQVFENPVVDLTDELSAVGGGALRHFAVTFDQQRDQVTFFREGRGPIAVPPLRSAGVSFTKTPAYWRVAAVVPGSPAQTAGIERGDLVIRINGEPMAKWDLRRYEQLVATTEEVAFTFLAGNRENEKKVKTFALVP
ncbi:MAG: aspartyl protease family protein [Verrucomicrobia bacterium]|nr:aspartyl protease family protein [Verrucomicrobiota bacterium]